MVSFISFNCQHLVRKNQVCPQSTSLFDLFAFLELCEMVNIFHRELAFWVPVAPEPLFLVSSRIFSSTNKLRASHQSTLVISFYTVPQRSRRIHVVCVTCKSASERYYIPPPPAHQPTLHVWDMSKSRAAETPWWRPDRADKHGIWRQHAKNSNSPRRPQGVVSTNKLTMHIHTCIFQGTSFLIYQFSQKPTFLCAGGVFWLHSTFFQNVCSINVSGKFLPTWKHQRTSFL